MTRNALALFVVAVFAVGCNCGGATANPDAGPDAGPERDGGQLGNTDAGRDGGADAGQDGGADAGLDGGVDAGSCIAGVACMGSNNPCALPGTTVCTAGVSNCVSPGDQPDGTVCGASNVCNGGECISCPAGRACTPANLCHLGVTNCSTGAAVCVDSNTNAPAGTECGSNQVCSATGACQSCTANLSCTPMNVCLVGTTSCSTGAQTCTATSVSLDAGTPCGAAQVCSPSGTCVGCAAGQSCTLAGVECRATVVTCFTGQSVCTDTGPGPDGVGCDGGSCLAGSCRTPLVISSLVNLSTDALTPGRSCGEAPSWAITSLTATGAVLDGAPDAGCLAAGDRVMAIDLQGTPTDFSSVGNHDLFIVGSVDGGNVTFSQSVRPTGPGAPQNTLSTDGGQKLALFRVPVFGEVIITDAGVVTAAAFDGRTGGVVAFRARSLTVEGLISAQALGYRSGGWSQDDSDCLQNVTTGSGESLTGQSQDSTDPNGGGAGGIGAASGPSYNTNDPLNSSAGHSAAGQPGGNSQGRTIGAPGVAYGVANGTQLTMGSGASGNLTCTTAFSGPPQLLPYGQNAGGIVYLVVDQLQVTGTGRISADPTSLGRSTAASGGYVLLRGRTLNVGADRVTANGMVATSVMMISNTSSPGYVALHSVNAVTGTTQPAANVTTITTP